MSVDIECPEGSSVPHNVVPSGSGSLPLGHICAHGDATQELIAFSKERQTASVVRAKIFDSFDPNAAENQQPHSDSVIIHPNENGFWRDEHIPGARHAATTPYPVNVLVIWAVFGTGTPVIRTRNFPGMTADVVSCCEGSGSGQALRQRARPAGVALATAPLLWALLASGFEAARAVLNGPYALALRPPGGEACVWDNGGDGARVPHVELRCESPLATTWRLTLREGSGEAVEYTRPASEWNPLGPNVLYRSGDGAATAAPDALTLTPG